MCNTCRNKLHLSAKSPTLKVVPLALGLLSKHWQTKNNREIAAQGLKGTFNRRKEMEGRKGKKINQKLLQRKRKCKYMTGKKDPAFKFAKIRLSQQCRQL